MINFLRGCIIFTAALFNLEASAAANGFKVLASVRPLALVAVSVAPLEQLQVLVPDGSDPHDFSLRPSDIDRLQEADIIIWSGAEAEPYLSGFARRWPDKHWIDLSVIAKSLSSKDPHYWLSPEVVIQAQAELATAFGVDSSSFKDEVESILEYSHNKLADVKGEGFYVYHPAYDHWIAEMGLNQVGYLLLTPEQKPGLKTILQVREHIKAGKVSCFFYEPDSNLDYINKTMPDLELNTQELDPLGTRIGMSKDGYAFLLKALADNVYSCLSKQIADQESAHSDPAATE